ncbi:hypothetical protein J5N97_023293 [Dioscorea zingiberensis]|uniref:Uncharacterized protein n=1 Tax=Dioscorea zingiberensis TaxID=325984 RepID=A0A9D5CBS1_9LILI|nr:hypothetical protein J5N97_023293 [Dioscorea zingiberensis]
MSATRRLNDNVFTDTLPTFGELACSIGGTLDLKKDITLWEFRKLYDLIKRSTSTSKKEVLILGFISGIGNENGGCSW